MEHHVKPLSAEPVAPAEQNAKRESSLVTEPVDTLPNATISESVTGWKLVVVVASVALACFLMLIDTMIISTVCTHSFHQVNPS